MRDRGRGKKLWADPKGRAGAVEEHMELYLKKGFSKKDAMKQVAKDRGVGKREIYQALIGQLV